MGGTSGTSHTGDTHYYYICLSKNRKRCVCHCKPVKKQVLEDYVIQASVNMLRRNSVITKIAETIVKVHERMIRDDSGLRRLQAKRDEAKKSADNLVKAIKQGIITDFTKDRLAALQEEVNRCEIEINKAMQKTYAHLTVEDVEKYLLSKVFEDPDDIKVRKLLVNTFIREIIWYGDHMVITYNFQEDVVPEKLTKSHVEQVEKEIEEAEIASSSFPVSSYICGCSSPTHSGDFRSKIPCFSLKNAVICSFWLNVKVQPPNEPPNLFYR